MNRETRHPGDDPARLWAEMTRKGIRLVDAFAKAETRGLKIATTPKLKVWEDGKVTLWRYRPLVERPRLGPLLIVHGLFGRQTVTDLEPRRSLVRRLLEAGVDLWVIDWGNPTRADTRLDFTDYAEFYLGDALAVMRRQTGIERAALMGICQGGVFTLIQAARHPEHVSGLVLAVTPVDFHADAATGSPGYLNLWARNLPEDLVEDLLREHGVLPGWLTGSVFQSLTPMKTLAKYSTELIGIADDAEALDFFLRMELWLSDRPDHPGAAAREWLVNCYARNDLINGRLAIDGEPVDLRRIRCPILNIHGVEDHIVPVPCTTALAGRTSSQDYRDLTVPAGHIGVFVSEKARTMVPGAVTGFLQDIAAPG